MGDESLWPDDERKVNIRVLAKIMRALEARLDALEALGKPQTASVALSPPPSANGSDWVAQWREWFPRGLTALVTKEGWGVSGWSSIEDNIDNLGSIFMSTMLIRGASVEDLQAFYRLLQETKVAADTWNDVRRERIVNKPGRGFGDDAQPAPASPEEVQRRAPVGSRSNPDPVDDPDEVPDHIFGD